MRFSRNLNGVLRGFSEILQDFAVFRGILLTPRDLGEVPEKVPGEIIFLGILGDGCTQDEYA